MGNLANARPSPDRSGGGERYQFSDDGHGRALDFCERTRTLLGRKLPAGRVGYNSGFADFAPLHLPAASAAGKVACALGQFAQAKLSAVGTLHTRSGHDRSGPVLVESGCKAGGNDLGTGGSGTIRVVASIRPAVC